MTDPVSDLLARIRNAGQARHAEIVCPSSRLKLAVARVLAANGYLDSVGVEAKDGKPVMRIRLRYTPDGRTVFIASRRDGAGILRMDRATRKITGHIPMTGLCVGMNFSPDRTLLYITDLRGGTISQVDMASLKVLKTIETGAGADCIEVVRS